MARKYDIQEVLKTLIIESNDEPGLVEEITEYTKEESNIEGYCTINYKTEQGWGPTYETKGMTGYFFGEAMVYTEFLPEYYVVDLYVNNIKATQIDLNLQGVIEQ